MLNRNRKCPFLKLNAIVLSLAMCAFSLPPISYAEEQATETALKKFNIQAVSLAEVKAQIEAEEEAPEEKASNTSLVPMTALSKPALTKVRSIKNFTSLKDARKVQFSNVKVSNTKIKGIKGTPYNTKDLTDIPYGVHIETKDAKYEHQQRGDRNHSIHYAVDTGNNGYLDVHLMEDGDSLSTRQLEDGKLVLGLSDKEGNNALVILTFGDGRKVRFLLDLESKAQNFTMDLSKMIESATSLAGTQITDITVRMHSRFIENDANESYLRIHGGFELSIIKPTMEMLIESARKEIEAMYANFPTSSRKIFLRSELDGLDDILMKAEYGTKEILENLKTDLIKYGYMDGAQVLGDAPQEAHELENFAREMINDLYEKIMTMPLIMGDGVILQVGAIAEAIFKELTERGHTRWGDEAYFAEIFKGADRETIGSFHPGEGFYVFNVFSFIIYDFAYGPAGRDWQHIILTHYDKNSEHFVDGNDEVSIERFVETLFDGLEIAEPPIFDEFQHEFEVMPKYNNTVGMSVVISALDTNGDPASVELIGVTRNGEAFDMDILELYDSLKNKEIINFDPVTGEFVFLPGPLLIGVYGFQFKAVSAAGGEAFDSVTVDVKTPAFCNPNALGGSKKEACTKMLELIENEEAVGASWTFHVEGAGGHAAIGNFMPGHISQVDYFISTSNISNPMQNLADAFGAYITTKASSVTCYPSGGDWCASWPIAKSQNQFDMDRLEGYDNVMSIYPMAWDTTNNKPGWQGILFDNSFGINHYMIGTNGFSGSDKAHSFLMHYGLGALRPEVKDQLIADGTLWETLYKAMVLSYEGISELDGSYLTSEAHKSSYDQDFNFLTFVENVHNITLESLNPIVKFDITDHDFDQVAGEDDGLMFHPDGKSEIIHQTEDSVAFVYHGHEAAKTITVSLGESYDPNGKPLTYGVEFFNAPEDYQGEIACDGSTCTITVPWFDAYQVADGTWLKRIDIGLYVNNGDTSSLVKFISVNTVPFEDRTYNADGLLESIVYITGGRKNPKRWTVPYATGMKRPDWKQDTFHYDDDGNLIGFTREIEIEDVNGDPMIVLQNYTAEGNLIEAGTFEQPEQIRLISYDRNGPGGTYSINILYGDRIHYAYDDLQGLGDPGNGTPGEGQIIQWDVINATTWNNQGTLVSQNKFSYDTDGNLITIHVEDPTGVLIAIVRLIPGLHDAYISDPDGNHQVRVRLPQEMDQMLRAIGDIYVWAVQIHAAQSALEALGGEYVLTSFEKFTGFGEPGRFDMEFENLSTGDIEKIRLWAVIDPWYIQDPAVPDFMIKIDGDDKYLAYDAEGNYLRDYSLDYKDQATAGNVAVHLFAETLNLPPSSFNYEITVEFSDPSNDGMLKARYRVRVYDDSGNEMEYTVDKNVFGRFGNVFGGSGEHWQIYEPGTDPLLNSKGYIIDEGGLGGNLSIVLGFEYVDGELICYETVNGVCESRKDDPPPGL